MIKVLRNLMLLVYSVAAAGLFVVVDAICQRRFGVSLTNLWVLIVPLGAIAAGMIACGGVYLGSVYAHRPATRATLALMMLIALLTPVAVYALIYWILPMQGELMLHDVVTFWDFLKRSIESRHLHMSRTLRDVGGVGQAGYLIEVVRLLGFQIGAVIVYRMLRAKLRCEKCDTYYRHVRSDKMTFDHAQAALRYCEEVAAKASGLAPQEVDPKSSAASARNPQPDSPVFVTVTNQVHRCPLCSTYVLEQSAKEKLGEKWKAVPDLARVIQFAPGLRPADVI